MGSGCSTFTPDRVPVPVGEQEEATVSGHAELRRWGDEPPKNTDILEEQTYQRLLRRYDVEGRPAAGLTSSMLALSGGAWDGAYSAGVLNGWTACGNRPRFTLVTGISTGALVAPFAFLGSAWDGELRQAFTDPDVKNILDFAPLKALFGALSLGVATPMERLVDRFATQDMLDAIGAESRAGRWLLIGTTNLDAERPVIWNVGAIANSGLPNRLELFRKVMLASAAVPGAFPPVFFNVTADGQTYQELHVDGGVMTSIFGVPIQVDTSRVRQMPFPHHLNMYLLQNNKLGPDNQVVGLNLPSILAKAASALIRSQTRGDLYRLWVSAEKHGFDYRLGFIPTEFDAGVPAGFDPVYMGRLFELGYEQAVGGYPWRVVPPGLETNSQPLFERSRCPAHPPVRADSP